MAATVFSIEGITCSSRVDPVSDGLGQVPGVGVDGDLATGAVTVISEGPIDDALVRAAVENADYQVKD